MRTLFLAFILSACGLPEAADEAQTAPEAQALTEAGVVVRVSATGKAPFQFEKHFEIDSTDAVYFIADVSVSKGMHTAAFEVHDPFGNVYQRTTQTLDIADSQAEAIELLPVNGTWISQYAMTGQWWCQIFIDGASTDSGQVAFVLN
jgi:hypothetical protein